MARTRAGSTLSREQSVPHGQLPNELRTFPTAADSDRLRDVWRLLACGLRRGELCGLRWEDIDLDAATVTVGVSRMTAAGVPDHIRAAWCGHTAAVNVATYTRGTQDMPAAAAALGKIMNAA